MRSLDRTAPAFNHSSREELEAEVHQWVEKLLTRVRSDDKFVRQLSRLSEVLNCDLHASMVSSNPGVSRFTIDTSRRVNDPDRGMPETAETDDSSVGKNSLTIMAWHSGPNNFLILRLSRKGSFSAREIAAVESIKRSLHYAVDIWLWCLQSQAHLHRWNDHSKLTSNAFVVFDRDHRVLAISDPARVVAAKRRSPFYVREGIIRFRGRLGRRLSDHASAHGTALGCATDRKRQTRAIFQISERRSVDGEIEQLLIIRSVSTDTNQLMDAIRDLYNVTPRESDLMAAMLNEPILKVAARDLGMSYETARVHMKNILRKTGWKNQAFLIKNLAYLHHSLLPPDDEPQT